MVKYPPTKNSDQSKYDNIDSFINFTIDMHNFSKKGIYPQILSRDILSDLRPQTFKQIWFKGTKHVRTPKFIPNVQHSDNTHQLSIPKPIKNLVSGAHRT